MHADSQIGAFDFAVRVNRLYAALIACASTEVPRPESPQPEPSLGGKLLYAGELDSPGRALVVAANIAGAASLTATADLAAQKQAVREGVVDFLVTSLDEALRILKNEVRKQETVAVCVAAAPEAIERAMLERGVLPDLLRPAGTSRRPHDDAFRKQGARRVETDVASAEGTLVAWRVSEAPARWLPQIDAIALDCVNADDLVARRWLRLAPRYLGRLAQGLRIARFASEASQAFISRVEEGMRRGTIGVEVQIQAEVADSPTR